MLVLHLRKDDYVTVNGNIIVKVSRIGDEQISLAIDAPRNVPIVRGKVLERVGEARPDCLNLPPQKKSVSPSRRTG